MFEGGDCADIKAILDGLREELARLETLGKQRRCQWLRVLSIELMSMCRKGCSAKWGKRSRATPETPKMVSIKGVMTSGSLAKLAATQRLCCESRLCASRTKPVRGQKRVSAARRSPPPACACLDPKLEVSSCAKSATATRNSTFRRSSLQRRRRKTARPGTGLRSNSAKPNSLSALLI